jgi:hypothetical protein
MNTVFPKDDRDDDLLRELLAAGGALAPAPPPELAQRVREKLRQRTQAVTVNRRPKAGWRGRFGPITATIAAGILLSLLPLLAPRQATWAQVASQVRTKPWILFTYPSDDGKQHQEWMSISRDMSARRDGDELSFHDHRLKLVTIYQAEERTIIRAGETPRDWKLELDRALDRVFQAIFRGDEKLQSPIPEVELVGQEQKEVERNGRKRLAFELKLRHTLEQREQTWKMTFLVDPATRLPQLVLMTNPQKDKGPEQFAIQISYPDPGPVDVYDLGAPRDAQVIDKLPSDDVQRLIAGIKASAERFGDCLVLNVTSAPDSPWHVGTPLATWQRGKKSRTVMGFIDIDAPPVKAPAAGVDELAWWRERWPQLIHVPSEIFDGKALWINEARWPGKDKPPSGQPWSGKRSDWLGPKWKRDNEWPGIQCIPLFYVYPNNLTVDFPLEAKVDPQRADGPTNTVRLTIGGKTSDRMTSEDRLWIDRERSYLVVRREMVGLDTSKSPPVETFTHTFIVEKAVRSPIGIWYPTVMRTSSRWSEDGQEKKLEAVTRHYFFFDAKFTDELFKPVERPGEPLQ